MGGGHVWAIAAGVNAALAAVSAKFISSQLLKYALVIFFNITMWGCFVNSLKALSSLQATVTNFATNFLSSGLAGYLLFDEHLSSKQIFKVWTERSFCGNLHLKADLYTYQNSVFTGVLRSRSSMDPDTEKKSD